MESPRKHSCSWRIDMEYGRLIWYRNFLCCRRFAEFCASEKIPPAWLTVLQYSLYFFWCCRHWKTPQFYHLVRGLCPLAANFPNQESQRRWESRKNTQCSHTCHFLYVFFLIFIFNILWKKKSKMHFIVTATKWCKNKAPAAARLPCLWWEIKCLFPFDRFLKRDQKSTRSMEAIRSNLTNCT